MKGLLFFILILLNGCRTNNSNILNDTDCSPPCWNGIEPGKTNRQQALSILNNKSSIDQDSIETWSLFEINDSIKWDFKPSSGNRFGNLYFIKDTVVGSNFIPIKSKLLLGTVINYLGNPDNILVIKHTQEKNYLSIFLGYPSKGTVILISINSYKEGDKAFLSENSVVDGIWYVEPELYNELISKLITGIPTDIVENNTHQWIGYGDVSPMIVKLDH